MFKNFYTVSLRKLKKITQIGNSVIVLMDRPKIINNQCAWKQIYIFLLSLFKFSECPRFKYQTWRQHKAENIYALFNLRVYMITGIVHLG